MLIKYHPGFPIKGLFDHVNEQVLYCPLQTYVGQSGSGEKCWKCESISCRLGSLTVGELVFVICQLKYGSQDKGT